MKPKSEDYVLGTGLDEWARLGLQHRIWADVAVGAWKRAGIGRNSHVMDLGCGPGHAAMDLTQLVAGEGSIIAVDESDRFLANLKSQLDSRGIENVFLANSDAQDLSSLGLKDSSLDAVYCRWVLCWLKEPVKALHGVHRLLKPGGRLVIHDYFNWKSMAQAPRSSAVEELVAAAERSFKARNGNVDIAGDLPAFLSEVGFEMTHFDVHQRVARGGGCDSTLEWILSWWRSYGEKLVELGYLEQERFENALRDLNQLESDPNRFFFCPPVIEIIAKK